MKTARSLEDRIIAQTFVEGNFRFAEGITANNKLQAERLKRNPELFQVVIDRLGQLAVEFRPDSITYVPNGARIFAELVAAKLALPIIHLVKQVDLEGQPGKMFYSRPADRRAVIEDTTVSEIVIIEDISRTFGSPNSVLELEGMRKKAKGLVSVLHRGEEEARQNFSLETQSVAARYLPPQMSEEELARYSAMAIDLRI